MRQVRLTPLYAHQQRRELTIEDAAERRGIVGWLPSVRVDPRGTSGRSAAGEYPICGTVHELGGQVFP